MLAGHAAAARCLRIMAQSSQRCEYPQGQGAAALCGSALRLISCDGCQQQLLVLCFVAGGSSMVGQALLLPHQSNYSHQHVACRWLQGWCCACWVHTLDCPSLLSNERGVQQRINIMAAVLLC